MRRWAEFHIAVRLNADPKTAVAGVSTWRRVARGLSARLLMDL